MSAPMRREFGACPMKTCLSSHPQVMRSRLNFAAINSAARIALPALLARWAPGGVVRGSEYIARNPTRADRRLTIDALVSPSNVKQTPSTWSIIVNAYGKS